MPLREDLQTILEFAKQLSDANVATVRVGDVEFTLQPSVPEVSAAPAPDTQPKSALDDAATYGYAEGSSLPGFVDPRKAKR